MTLLELGFTVDGMVASKAEAILTDKRLVTAIGRCSSHDTSELESYHSTINRNCPKMYSFTYDCMVWYPGSLLILVESKQKNARIGKPYSKSLF